MKKEKKRNSFHGYIFLMLIALEFLMSFTFLGYIHVEPISITFAYLPIIFGACLLGTFESGVLGFLFGLASMYKASAYYVMSLDKIFSPLQSGEPVKSILLSIGVRTLFGILIGLIFAAAKKRNHTGVWIGICAFLAPKLHAGMTYLGIQLLFPETGYTVAQTFQASAVEFILLLLGAVLTVGLWKLGQKPAVRKFEEYVGKSGEKMSQNRHAAALWILFVVFFLVVLSVSAVYFAQRIFYMLNAHGVIASDIIQYDLLHLQIQFMMATLALGGILILQIVLVYKYFSYREYMGEMDALTNVMGRRLFMTYCERLQRPSAQKQGQNGWFLFLDVDYFKKINDTFGHPEGDRVLESVAAELKRSFGTHGKIGRMGGDEFAVMLEKPLRQEKLEKKLVLFLEHAAAILPDFRVTCSIGACSFSYPVDMEKLYKAADEILYEAKEQGRARYVIGTYEEK